MEARPQNHAPTQPIYEPADPGAYVRKLFAATPNAVVGTDGAPQDKVQLEKHRVRMERGAENITAIARRLAAAYKEVCHQHGFVPQRVRVYLIGGRVRQKPLEVSGDFDFMLTNEQKTGMLLTDHKQVDLQSRDKVVAKKEFIKRMRAIATSLGLTEEMEGREPASFIEVKGFGMLDADFRAASLKSGEQSILLYTDQA